MAKKRETEKTYFSPINIQNVPKSPVTWWHVRKADTTSVPEFTVCGWEFTLDRREDSLGQLEGFILENNFRRVFLPEKGHYVVSRDFSGQELRIIANLSGEPSWIDAFLNGEDIHAKTAKTIWGEENYSKTLRSMAKAINFGLIYGIGPLGLSKQINTTEEQAQEYINMFFEKHKAIHAYLNSQAIKASQTFDLANFYGRKRRFHRDKDMYGRLNNEGKRKAFNTPIQSMGAEVTKLGLLKVYYNILKNPEYEGRVFFMSTIHDEINLSVEFSLIKEVAYKQGEAMLHYIPGTKVPILTGLEIGHSMGLTWKFKQNPDTLELIPDYAKYSD